MVDGVTSFFKNPTTSHPCPYCGSQNTKYSSNSWSGGIIGSMMLHEFMCKDCKNEFNGKTGKPITLKERAIVIGKLLLYPTIFIVVIIGAVKLVSGLIS